MKSILKCLLMGLFLLMPLALWADSTSVPVSGYFTDSTGTPLDGTKTITYRIYAALTGGSALWVEEQSVTCDAGVCSTTLGANDTNPVDTIVSSNSQLFLTIQIAGESESDSRVELSAVPWALVANSLASGAVTSTAIASSAVTSGAIASSAVTSAKISDGTIANADVSSTAAIAYSKLSLASSLLGSDILDGTIATADLADSSVSTAKIADSAVTSAKISDATVATADLANSSVTASKLDQSIAPSWTGAHSFATPPSVALGGSSATGKPVITANVNTTAVGNVGAGEDNLMTYTLPANALNTNGRGIRLTAWGTVVTDCFAAQTLRCYFGATSITGNYSSTCQSSWFVEGIIIRTGAASQEAISLPNGGTRTRTTPAETMSADVVIRCTGSATNDNEIQQTGMVVEVLN